MTEGVALGLTIGDSQIHGQGCFATVVFQETQQIAEYIGERISLIEAARRRRAFGDQSLCDVDFEWAIDGSRGGNATRYINHSCQPNAYVVISEGRIFIHALRKIFHGEEITTDYLNELHSERVKCQCRTTPCGSNGKDHHTFVSSRT